MNFPHDESFKNGKSVKVEREMRNNIPAFLARILNSVYPMKENFNTSDSVGLNYVANGIKMRVEIDCDNFRYIIPNKFVHLFCRDFKEEINNTKISVEDGHYKFNCIYDCTNKDIIVEAFKG